MSKFNLDDQLPETYEFKYRGLVFTLYTVPDNSAWSRKQSELFVKLGLIADKQSAAPVLSEMEQVEKDTMTKAVGAAMVGTFIASISDFEIDGEQFSFSNPSDLPEYQTQGEELMGQNEIMQNAVYRQCITHTNNLPDYDVVALGKSSPVSNSGDETTGLANKSLQSVSTG